MVKCSSLVYAVGLAELVLRAQQVNATLHRLLLIFSITGALYFPLSFATDQMLSWIERKGEIFQMIQTR